MSVVTFSNLRVLLRVKVKLTCVIATVSFGCFIVKSVSLNGLSSRRESERRNHSLARHADILAAVETRLSLLNMTFMKYVDSKLCCFIPGKVKCRVYPCISVYKKYCVTTWDSWGKFIYIMCVYIYTETVFQTNTQASTLTGSLKWPHLNTILNLISIFPLDSLLILTLTCDIYKLLWETHDM